MALDPRLRDKEWRMSHLYKIRTKDAKLVKFKRNRAQQHFENNRHSRNIILKSRQLGFTTDETIDAFDDALFKKNFDTLFIAHVKDDAEEIFDKKVGVAWDNLKPGLKKLYNVESDRANQMTFDFKDGSKSSFFVKVSGRSGTYMRLHVTEYAKMCIKEPRKAKEIISGTIPAVPFDGRVDIESTAEGEIGRFHDMFWEAWERPRKPLSTEFKAHFYNWTWDDTELAKIKFPIPVAEMDSFSKFNEYQHKHNLTDIQITYYYMKWLSLGKDWNVIHQEYPTTVEEAFVSSGNKLFATEALSQQVVNDQGEVIGEWTYYKKYNPLHTYGAGADPSEGIGGDNATIVVIDFSVGEVVAVYYSKLTTPDVLAYEAVRVCKTYGNCILAPERNNHGHAFIVVARDLYDNLYEEVVKNKTKDNNTKKLGFLTTGASKPIIMYGLNTAVNENTLKFNDKRLIREARTYQKEDLSRVDGDEETIGHWDGLMALAICWEMRNHADYVDPRNPQQVWDEDENHLITNREQEELFDRFGIT